MAQPIEDKIVVVQAGESLTKKAKEVAPPKEQPKVKIDPKKDVKKGSKK